MNFDSASLRDHILWAPRSDVLTAAAKIAHDNAELMTRLANDTGNRHNLEDVLNELGLEANT